MLKSILYRNLQTSSIGLAFAHLLITGITWLCLIGISSTPVFADAQADAKQILDKAGTTGGLIVHIGFADSKLTAALQTNSGFVVHGVSTDTKLINASRDSILSQGKYGTISFGQYNGTRLPYGDNMVNLAIIENANQLDDKEVMRVLAPRGVMLVKSTNTWQKSVKPVPDDIDDWSHYLHDASGNAVAADTQVGAPKHLQWLGSPRWSRHHDRMASMSALVSSAGKMFYIMDEGSRVSIQLPPDWQLVARDAFNGVILWKRPLNDWFSTMWPLKSGPTQLARRLVATPKRIYVTLGLHAPVTAIDAATGKTLHTFKETSAAEEIIVKNNILFVLVRKGKWELDDYKPEHNVGDQARVRKQYQWNENPRIVMAFDTRTFDKLWEQKTKVAPLTMSSDDSNLYVSDGDHVIAFNRTSGKQEWKSKKVGRRAVMNFNFGPKLVAQDQAILYAGGDRKMHAFEPSTGKELWTTDHDRGGYESPEDLLVIGDLVWSAPTTRGGDSGVWKGRNVESGKVEIQFAPNVKTYWFHHRCYLAKATTNFLLPSRTGIEFVDPKNKDWDINHWVRGGCLYGVLPCNGLLYAPPHNCACYPEAKLFGFNALAPTSASRAVPTQINEKQRLEKGPAFAQQVTIEKTSSSDWPTFRHDATRNGYTSATISTDLSKSWKTKLPGKLSTLTIANGRAFVASINTHTVHALDADTGEPQWSYTTGARVDSPPTIYKGRVLFGSADGYVYCLRATDGELIWRFRAAPEDRRIMVWEQLESVWPVKGSILVQNDIAFCIAGRSMFVDGGLRFIKLNPLTGEKISETNMDDRDPNTGNDLQDHIKTLQMPVGLPDILSSDGKRIYMRSQVLDFDGKRTSVAPNSGSFAGQGSVQRGSTSHLFSPTGFLDDSWFHRSYWVYGRSFAGGHAGYYQAGKFTPAGRLIVADKDNVYGFGRKPQYLKWTTILEHQLFSAPKPSTEIEDTPIEDKRRKGGNRKPAAPMINIAISKSLNPTGKALAVQAWVNATKPGGVIIARGGPANGYALTITKGLPQFHLRSDNTLKTITSKGKKITGQWTHVAGVLRKDKTIELYVNGKLAASGKATGLITGDPIQAMQIGADDLTAVGEYKSPFPLTGAVDEVRVFHGELTANEIKAHFDNADDTTTKAGTLVAAYSFNRGSSLDNTENKNHGKNTGGKPTKGVRGGAMVFAASNAAKPGNNKPNNKGGAKIVGTGVTHNWTKDLPIFVQAIVKADNTIFIAGAADIINEEETFQRFQEDDVQAKLKKQDQLLDGKEGGLLLAVSAKDGRKLAEYKIDSLPTWDGMVAANGNIYLTTKDGHIICLKGSEIK